MKTIVCESAPVGRPVVLREMPSLCPFCGYPTAAHKTFEAFDWLTKAKRRPSERRF